MAATRIFGRVSGTFFIAGWLALIGAFTAIATKPGVVYGVLSAPHVTVSATCSGGRMCVPLNYRDARGL